MTYTRERYNASKRPSWSADDLRAEFDRVQRGIPHPTVIDVRDFGLEASENDDTATAKAVANVAAMRKITDACSDMRGATIYIPWVGEGRCFRFGAASSTSKSAIGLPPYTDLRIEGHIMRSQYVQGRFVGLSYRNRVYGGGTIDGNAGLAAVRGLGNHNIVGPTSDYAAPVGERGGYWRIEGMNIIRPSAFCINLRGDYIWIHDNDVDSTWGSVDGEEPDDVSGDNCDGIHVLNASNVFITNNRITAIDDCIAWTCGNTFDAFTEFENVHITDNICLNTKAQNVASAGLGSSGTAGTLSKTLAGGVRVTTESGLESGLTLNNVHIKDNTFIGGAYGVQVGHQSNATNRVVSGVQIKDNRFLRQHANDAAADYNASGGNGRLGCIRLRTADDVLIQDNDFDNVGCGFIWLLNARNVRIRGNWMRDMDVSRSDFAVSNIKQRAAIVLENTPTTMDSDNILIEDNTGETIDGAFIYIEKASTGTMSNIRLRRNRVTGHNGSGQTVVGAAAYSLNNGASASGITILENRDNKVDGYDITSTTAATEVSCTTDESNSVLVDIAEWDPSLIGPSGSANMFKIANGSGTAAASVTTERALYCTGSADNDGVRTDPFSAAPWVGRAMEVVFEIYIVSGTVACSNAQTQVNIAADATDRWREHRVILTASETGSVRVWFHAEGGAAEWYLGAVRAKMVNV